MRPFFWGIVGANALIVAAFILGVVYLGPAIFNGIVDRIDHTIEYQGNSR